MSILINDTYEAELSVYDGPRKQKMVNPEINLQTDFSKMQNISRSRGEEIDFNFFLDIVSKDIYPEYDGYCYRYSNDQGLSIRPKAKIIYVPLLDIIPANPTTLKNCLLNTDKGFVFIHVINNYIALLPVSYGITLN